MAQRQSPPELPAHLVEPVLRLLTDEASRRHPGVSILPCGRTRHLRECMVPLSPRPGALRVFLMYNISGDDSTRAVSLDVLMAE